MRAAEDTRDDRKETLLDRAEIHPYALRTGEGQALRYGPNAPRFVVKAGELGPGRRLAFAELRIASGEEPADHTHDTEDEIFYVTQGAVGFRCGDDQFELEDGGFMFLPRGLQHGFTIRSAGEVLLLVITSPADEQASGGWGGLIANLESRVGGADGAHSPSSKSSATPASAVAPGL